MVARHRELPEALEIPLITSSNSPVSFPHPLAEPNSGTPSSARWQFWMDVGGTFTDYIARSPSGKTSRAKVLSTATIKGVAQRQGDRLVDIVRQEPANFWVGYQLFAFTAAGQAVDLGSITASEPSTGAINVSQSIPAELGNTIRYEIQSPEEAPILAIRRTLGLSLTDEIPAVDLRLGTTRGTNALLTRTGARTALLVTKGFRDALAIGYQNRPELFALRPQKPEPLTTTIIEIDERLDASGDILESLDEQTARSAIGMLYQQQIQSLAICLMHSHKNPVHEQRLRLFAQMAGFQEVSISSEVWPLMKLVPRGDTTVVDAYLNPVLRTYVARLAEKLPGSSLQLMTSSGGLARKENFRGKDSLLSGPAGGVIGVKRVAEAAGIAGAIGFDMGGTSTDICRSDESQLRVESTLAEIRVAVPHLPIDTIAAGGGSICKLDGDRLIVGPASAGASPGPACYGRGGPLTVTDCNLITGRLLEASFAFPLDRAAAKSKLHEIASELQQSTGQSLSIEAIAAGFLHIANTKMAAAIGQLARDTDVRDLTLVSFGSAAGQHAVHVAEELGMRSVIVHPDAGVMSALGIGLADVVKHQARGVYQLLADLSASAIEEIFQPLVDAAVADVIREGLERNQVTTQRVFDLRYHGTDQPLRIEEPTTSQQATNDDWARAFAERHQATFGYVQQRAIEVVAAHITAVGKSQQSLPTSSRLPEIATTSNQTQAVWLENAWHEIPVVLREKQSVGCAINGPSLLAEALTVVLLPAGWRAVMLSGGEWLLEQTASSADAVSSPETAHSTSQQRDEVPLDPVLLEVINLQLAIVAEQMGGSLRSTSVSVNVKERLDYSAAVFDGQGNLIATAAHIPVHLGAMSETVKQLLVDFPALQPGDVLITNDPYRGGSHLPDVTVVTPVFDNSTSSRLCAFVGCRAHHAEIGGITPGSMPAFSKNLAEEGVLLRGQKLIDRGVSRLDAIAEQLQSARYPTRALADNLADLSAQLAANRQGETGLATLARAKSWSVLEAYFQYLQDSAAAKVRRALLAMPAGERRFVDHLDDGTPIRVSIAIADGRAIIDFAGTGPVSQGNLNANRAIVSSATLYVLRLLINEDLPLNQGMLAPVEIKIPEGLLSPPIGVSPETSAAIVGGNVETSQRIVDVLLGAFGIAAASQGTMNNLLFGDTTFGYYETICGGSGATSEGPGADALHTHMTNTRLTDPEVLEHRFPVRLHKLAIRRGSGGAGQHRGGDGVIRELEMLRPLTVSLVTQRRGHYLPYGIEGGASGAAGINLVIRRDGSREVLPSSTTIELAAGDRLHIETPGGGGWGTPEND